MVCYMIDPHAPEPAYQQLAALIRERIRSGQSGRRQPIPSITEMVEETGLATGTVQKARQVLLDEGLVYAVPGRGTFVK